jgi:hypothetical protein
MRTACLAASWGALAAALVFIGLSFTASVHITVWTSILCVGLPSLGCFVWTYEMKDSPFPKKGADGLQPGKSSSPSRGGGSLSSRQRFVTLAFAVVLGLSCETAMAGLSHGKSVETNGNFFRCTLKGCNSRVPITEAEFWQLQAYQVRLFCSVFFPFFSGLPIVAFTVQKSRRRTETHHAS